MNTRAYEGRWGLLLQHEPAASVCGISLHSARMATKESLTVMRAREGGMAASASPAWRYRCHSCY